MAQGKVEICGVNTSRLKLLKESEKRELLNIIKNGTYKQKLHATLKLIDAYLNKLKEQDNYEEIKEALNPSDYNMIVTPKEIDDLIENMKDVIARGINYAV